MIVLERIHAGFEGMSIDGTTLGEAGLHSLHMIGLEWFGMSSCGSYTPKMKELSWATWMSRHCWHLQDSSENFARGGSFVIGSGSGKSEGC